MPPVQINQTLARILDKTINPNNIEKILSSNLHRLERTENRDVTVNELREIASQLGDIDFRAVDGEGALRAILSAINVLEELGTSAYFLLRDGEGTPQVWGDADTGAWTAMGGNWVVDADGQRLYGLLFPIYFNATYLGNERQAWLGMYVPQGGNKPVWSIIFTGPDGSNLITDPNLLSGWTDPDSSYYEDLSGGISHDSTVDACPGILYRNIAVLDGDILTFGSLTGMESGILAPYWELQWLDASAVVLSTDTIVGNNTNAYVSNQQTFIAPAHAESVNIIFRPGDAFNDSYFKDVQIYIQSVSLEFRMSDSGLIAIRNGTTYDLLDPAPDRVRTLKTARPNIFVINSVAETDIMPDVTIPGDLVLNDNILHVRITGRFVNLVGTAQTLTIKTYFGTLGAEVQVNTSFALSVASAATERGFVYDAYISQSAIGGNKLTCEDFLTVDSLPQGRTSNPVAVASLTADRNLIVTATLGSANQNLNILSRKVIVEIIPEVPDDSDVFTYFSQPDETDGIDTQISSLAPTTNYATNAVVTLGESNAAVNIFRGLIKPDISTLMGKTIISAKLNLIVVTDLSSNARDCKAYRLLRDWVESEATYTIWKTANNWTTLGAGSAGNDYDATVLATTSFTGAEVAGTVKTFDLDVVEFQKFVDGINPWYGLLLKFDTETNDAMTFGSSSAANPWLRPYFVVKYAR